MAIRIDARELEDVLRLTPPQQNIMLAGKHGIGKSEIIRRFFSDQKGMKVVPLFLGQMSDPGDLIGLLHKEQQTGRSVFLPPYWWPAPDQPVVLFLDELNRARPELLQSVHELALNRTLAGKRLPEGSIVVSAVNTGDEYQLTDLDPALVSRFNLYEFAPTAEDWLVWAGEHGVDRRVVAFIQQNAQYLDGDETSGVQQRFSIEAGLVKTPDRRAWVRVSDLIRPLDPVEDRQIKIVAGIVGTTAAMAFKKSLSRTDSLTAEQILLAFGRHHKKLEKLTLQQLVLLNEEIVYWLNGGRCPAKREQTARNNLLAYVQRLQQGEQREAVAHLASMLENPRFGVAMNFAAASAQIIRALTRYVEGIKVE